MSSTAWWSWDARPTSAWPNLGQGWDQCARSPDPCKTTPSAILRFDVEELTMSKLLADVIEAHGGLDRWRSVSLGEATIVTGGGLWGLKGLVQDANPRRMTVSLHEERASVKPFGDPDWHTEFTPERIAIVRSDGSGVKVRAPAETVSHQPPGQSVRHSL